MFDWTKIFSVGSRVLGAIRAFLKGEAVNESFTVTISGRQVEVTIVVAPPSLQGVKGQEGALLMQIRQR